MSHPATSSLRVFAGSSGTDRRTILVRILIAILASLVLWQFATAIFAGAGEPYASDNFDTRTVAAGWGTADTSQTYVYVGPKSDFAVGLGVGVMNAKPGIGRGAFVDVPQRDLDMSAQFSGPPTGTAWGYAGYVVARRTPLAGEYRARVHVDATGRVLLDLVRGDSTGSDVMLVGEKLLSGVTIGNGAAVDVTLEVNGANPTTIRAKAWQHGGVVKTAWDLTATDSTPALQSGGAVGVRLYNGSKASSAVSLTTDSWATSEIPTPPTTTTTTTVAPTTTTTVPPTTTTTTVPPTTTTTTVAPPASVPSGKMADDSSFGAAPLGSASYAAPADAFYVSPSGSDANPGTKALPFKTLVKAIKIAPTGSTIVMRAGTYHESVEIFREALTIQNYPGEAVVMKGSVPVNGWVADGAAWRHDGLTTTFVDGGYPEMIDPAYPLSTYPEQTFRNGAPLTQVASKASVKPGTFFYDNVNRQLFVGDDPSGQLIETSDLQDALFVNQGDGTTIRGIGFEDYATPISDRAAVKGYANNLTFENNVISYNSAVGLSVIGNNIKVLNSTVSHNGQMGVQGDQVRGGLVQGNLLEGNNSEHMALNSAQGGLKLTRSSAVLVSKNLAQNNLGRGLWLDLETTNVNIVRNIARGNTQRGIQVEISGQVIVASNYVYDNGAFGIYVVESKDVQVYNNTSVRNQRNIYVLEGTRTSTNPDVPEDVQNVRIANNIVWGTLPGSTYSYGVDDSTQKRTPAQMNVTSDNNVFFRTSTAAPTWLVAWCDYPTKMRVYTTLSAFATATGNDRHSVGIDGGTDPIFVDVAHNNLTLSPASPARGTGIPLPADVAAALGVTAGIRVDMGAVG